jgi:hypothetical protein
MTSEQTISRDEFEQYIDAIGSYQALIQRPAYQVLERNFSRLDSMINLFGELERFGGQMRYIKFASFGPAFVGEVTNWLTSSRLYSVSERDSFVSYRGEGSAEVNSLDAAFSRSFDRSPAYRFLYNLRDYAQHCSPPGAALRLSKSDDGSPLVELTLTKSDLLAARFNWSRHARTFLADAPDEISLMPLIREAMIEYRTIEDQILLLLLARSREYLALMRDGIAKVAHLPGQPAVLGLPSDDDSSEQMAFQSFPTLEMLDKVEAAASSENPLTFARRRSAEESPLSTGQQEAQRIATAILAAYLLNGGASPELRQYIDTALSLPNGPNLVIDGLINVSITHLLMLSKLLATSPEHLLGSSD